MDKTKPHKISKQTVWKAYKLVRAKKGAPGIDDESIQRFEEKLKDNLYKIWNRMSSGSYFPPPVKVVEIPKKNGGTRTLGVPTVSEASALIYSIVETAKENNFNPLYYMTYLFETLPNIDLKDPSKLDQLLPWSDSLPEKCHIPNQTK